MNIYCTWLFVLDPGLRAFPESLGSVHISPFPVQLPVTSPRLPACVPPLPTPPRSRSWSCHRGVRFHAPAQMNGRSESAKQTSRWRRMERMRMRSDCIWADACRLLLQTVLQLTRSSSTPLQRSRLALVPPSCTIYIAPASRVLPSERTVPTSMKAAYSPPPPPPSPCPPIPTLSRYRSHNLHSGCQRTSARAAVPS